MTMLHHQITQSIKLKILKDATHIETAKPVSARVNATKAAIEPATEAKTEGIEDNYYSRKDKKLEVTRADKQQFFIILSEVKKSFEGFKNSPQTCFKLKLIT